MDKLDVLKQLMASLTTLLLQDQLIPRDLDLVPNCSDFDKAFGMNKTRAWHVQHNRIC